LIELPAVLIGIVPIYNLPGVHTELRFPGELLADISHNAAGHTSVTLTFRQLTLEDGCGTQTALLSRSSAQAYCGRGRVLIPPLRQMHLPEVERAETETSAHNILTNLQPTIRPISILSPFGTHWDTIGPVRKRKEGKSGVTMWGLLVPAG
jgi:hypothetical protein